MSATRDKSQKTTFVYSNLYQLYRKGKEAATEASVPVESKSSYFEIPSERNVLKAGDLKAESATLQVDRFNPPELTAKRLEARAIHARQESSISDISIAPKPSRIPVGKPASPVPDSALSSLKQNLLDLQSLHARLRFMLKELEDLSQDE